MMILKVLVATALVAVQSFSLSYTIVLITAFASGACLYKDNFSVFRWIGAGAVIFVYLLISVGINDVVLTQFSDMFGLPNKYLLICVSFLVSALSIALPARLGTLIMQKFLTSETA